MGRINPCPKAAGLIERIRIGIGMPRESAAQALEPLLDACRAYTHASIRALERMKRPTGRSRKVGGKEVAALNAVTANRVVVSFICGAISAESLTDGKDVEF